MNALEPIPTRPLLRWHGGKWRLAPRIIACFPPHRIYIEPFAGAISVLLRKPRAYADIVNDLDHRVVNLFRILRDPHAASELLRRLELTPFARVEFEAAYGASDDPIEQARALIVRAFMGFGAAGNTRMRTGFRGNSNRRGTTPAHDWANYPAAIAAIVARLQGVVVECQDALAVVCRYDGAETLHYLDPPYLPETRSLGNPWCVKHQYAHEMTVADHERLLTMLTRGGLAGMVVLSGYPSALYDDSLSAWRRVEIPAYADGARARTEVLWLNPAACAALDRAKGSGPLFGEGVREPS